MSSSLTSPISIFGEIEGKQVHKISIQSPSGNLRASFISYGATLQSFQKKEEETESSNSNWNELVLGFDTLEQYINTGGHLGATCGRYANRLENATFPSQLISCGDDAKQIISLPVNNNSNCLHGGPKGFSKIVWDGKFDLKYSSSSSTTSVPTGVTFRYSSPDGDQGFPGELEIEASYYFDIFEEKEEKQQQQKEGLFMEFKATCPSKSKSGSVCNICNHAYWNLSGFQKQQQQQQQNATETHHLFMPNAKYYLPTDKFLIPTGEILSTKNTVLDFVSNGGKPLSIKPEDEEGEILKNAKGFDHCFVLGGNGKLSHAATLSSTTNNNSSMRVYTTLPGVQLYSGNFLSNYCVDTRVFNNSVKFGFRSGICLETQLFPNCPNQAPHFLPMMSVVKPGETWKHLTVHVF